MTEKILNYYKLQVGPSSSSYSETSHYFSSPRKVPPFSFFFSSAAHGGDPQQKREWRGQLAAAPTSRSGADAGEAATVSAAEDGHRRSRSRAPGAAASSSRRAASGTVPQPDQAHWDGHLSLFQAVMPTRCVSDGEVMEMGSSSGQAVEEEEMGRILERR
ncbi:hypothetical protein M9H77_28882 [Catharanthus roseus]|uniref:Uncharacterized protein n=1 Tax=Catharanthus roseus TaxID=4058 RepID=A0ACC0AIU5_CATRO|nr:hypothetical protein M9H77_28882 [Catharanthus roseus]